MERCPILNPEYCLGARCRLYGICDHNRRLDGRVLASTYSDRAGNIRRQGDGGADDPSNDGEEAR